MAAVTAVLGATAAAVSLGNSVVQSSRARKQEKAAQKALDNYKRQDLSNTTLNLSVPTRGANIARQEAVRTQAEMSNLAARGSNVAGIAAGGGIGQVTSQTMQNISAQLEEAEFRLQAMMAGDQQRIQQMQEQRENIDIQGLGAQIAGSQGRRDAGISQAISTGASLAELSQDTAWGERRLWGGQQTTQTTLSGNTITTPKTN